MLGRFRPIRVGIRQTSEFGGWTRRRLPSFMHRSTALAVVAALGLIGGCSTVAPPAGPAATTTTTSSPTSTSTSTPSSTTPTPTPTTTPRPTPTRPTPSDGSPREARLSIPAIKVSGLVVQPYQGWTDDGPGTAIQNRGIAASPFGPRGGTGPGGVGNYQVTAHRTTKPAPFRDLPALVDGDLAHVDFESEALPEQGTIQRQMLENTCSDIPHSREADAKLLHKKGRGLSRSVLWRGKRISGANERG